MCKLTIENPDDARMRLTGSVVMHRGRPVYISESTHEVAEIVDILKPERKTVPIDDLDLVPVKVGNVILGNTYQFIQRAPVRKYKQGLNGGNIKYGDMPWGVHKVELTTKALGNAIMNNYPSPAQAMEDVLYDKKEAVPISRHWGFGNINGVCRVFYKDRPVGFLDDEENIIISKKYFFLKEDLIEVLNNVR